MTTRGKTSTISTAQFAEFTGAVISQLPFAVKDISPEQLRHLIENQDELKEILSRAFADLKPLANIYPVTVDYEANVEEAIELGKYHWTNPNISSDNYPPKRKGKANVQVELVHFDRYISTNAATKELSQRGYRPADLRELLALGEKYPDIYDEFPIVALGSVWRDPKGDRHVPCLYRSGRNRHLRLVWFGGGWYARWRFAAVRK